MMTKTKRRFFVVCNRMNCADNINIKNTKTNKRTNKKNTYSDQHKNEEKKKKIYTLHTLRMPVNNNNTFEAHHIISSLLTN